MMPVTDFLSCTEPLNDFESLSYHQTHHAKTYVTGLAAGGSKTVQGISREVLPAQSERALNKFLTQYDWDEDEVNHERLEELQKYGKTRWSHDGYIIIDDSVNQKTGEELPGAGRFYDHSEGETVWGQNLVYAFYTDEKTAYPLAFQQYESTDDDDDETKYDLARDIITELEDEVGVPADGTAILTAKSSRTSSYWWRYGACPKNNSEPNFTASESVLALISRIYRQEKRFLDRLYYYFGG